MFKLKTFEEIKNLYPNREIDLLDEDIKQLVDWLPNDYLEFVKEKYEYEYSGEFRFLCLESAIEERDSLIKFSKENKENFHRYYKNWWIFAETGTGDSWLFNKNGKVYWNDHESSTNKEDFRPIDIDFKQWVVLGDLMKQLEQLGYTDDYYDKLKNEKYDSYDTLLKLKYRKLFTKQLNLISREIKYVYPYRIYN